MLELAFATEELRSACEDAACADALYGTSVAETLIHRLADMRAAGHLLDIPFAEVRPAADDIPEHVVVSLAAGRFLVIAPNHAHPPRTPDGAVSWEGVNRIIILRLE